MKRILLGITLLMGMLVLSGCDEFGKEEEYFNLWMDEQSQELHVSFYLNEPQNSEEDDTTEVITESVHLLMFDSENGVWESIYVFEGYHVEDAVISYDYAIYGDVLFKIATVNSLGETTNETPEVVIYMNEPQFIYHFDAWFDSWSGKVSFNFGLNEFALDYIVIEKSQDGGTTWAEVIETTLFVDDAGYVKNQVEYFEFEEGNYVYRINVFDASGELVDSMNTWGEIQVYFDDSQFTGDPDIYYVSGNYDTYGQNVYLWWDASGDFDEFLIEKSVDLNTWEVVETLPRVAHSFNYQELVDGEYFYRVSALVNNEVQVFFISEDSIRVKQGALLGGFNAWVDWNTGHVQLDWQFNNEGVEEVIIERRELSGEFVEIASFGSLKNMHTDELLVPGIYVYRVRLLDAIGEELDSLESIEIEIKQPEHVYHLNAWHNQSTGEVEFNFGFNQQFVDVYVIEKSQDGGLTWTEVIQANVELFDHGWYKDHIRVYELNEGVYSYKITGYDEHGNVMGMVYSYSEVVVNYDNLNLDEPTQIHYIDGNSNIYDQSVYLWWNGQGNFTTHLIEYSTDLENWVVYEEVPRVTTTIQITGLEDGEYFFRVSAVNELGETLHSLVTPDTVRVKENALIGDINAWYNWNNEIQLNWDMLKEDVHVIRLERSVNDGEFELLGEYGPLKTTYIDSFTESGLYTYRITLLDEFGQVLDQMESNQIDVYVDTE